MREKDSLALGSRRSIFEYVQRTPGAHLRGVERDLHLPFGQVIYHLDYLQRNGLLVVKKDGGFKRYFVRGLVPREERPFIAAFRHEVPRRVGILLLLKPGLSHRDILEHVGVSGSTLSFHLAKMVESDVLDRASRGTEHLYRVRDPEIAARALTGYRASYGDPVVDLFAEHHASPAARDVGEVLAALTPRRAPAPPEPRSPTPA